MCRAGAKLDVTVTRKQFEAACEDLFTLCIDTAKAVLECALSDMLHARDCSLKPWLSCWLHATHSRIQYLSRFDKCGIRS